MTFELRPEDTQVVDQAIQAGLIKRRDEVVEVGVETLRSRLQARFAPGATWRENAIRRMQEFADEYRLSLGEPITRALLHEEHRY